MRYLKLSVLFMLQFILSGCTMFVEYDSISFECYENEQMNERVADYDFYGDKTVRISSYQLDSNYNSIIKESTLTYSKKSNGTYTIHGDQELSFQYTNGTFKSITRDMGFCIEVSDVSKD